MKKIYAAIITIGDELLIGQVIDTNSAFIAQELNNIGVWMRHRVAVGDNWDDIWEAMEEAKKVADIILITGGLGPTADDITKPLLNHYFGGKMVVHKKTLHHIENYFSAKGMPMIEINYKQSEVPDICTVLMNDKGTAPGMLFNKEGKIFVSMPGVPHEMRYIMENHVIPFILQNFQLPAIAHKTLTTLGIGESFLAEELKGFEKILPENVRLAYLPYTGGVRLRLTAYGDKKEEVNLNINYYFDKLSQIIDKHIVTLNDKSLFDCVASLLIERSKTISTAESCTGGSIGDGFTNIPGSSDFYQGSIVCYQNSIKEDVLKVNKLDIEKHGVISELVVSQMAHNVRIIMNSDYSIATSGILGPQSVEGKPVGTVWIAVASANKTIAQEFHFTYDRNRNKEISIKYALNMLRVLISNS